MALYKRASEAVDAPAVARLAEEVRDRYGAPPPEVGRLFAFASLRLRAEGLGLTQVDLAGGALHLKFAETAFIAPEALFARVRALPGASLSPQGVLRAPPPTGRRGAAGPGRAHRPPGRGRARRRRAGRIMLSGRCLMLRTPILVPSLLALLLACRTPAVSSDPVILRLGDQEVRKSDFDRYVAALEKQQEGTLAPDVRRGPADGLPGDPPPGPGGAHARPGGPGADEKAEQAGVEQLLAAEVNTRVEVPEAEVAAYFEQHKSDFGVPERWWSARSWSRRRTRRAT
jgi:hypothetical protein